jgi:hypothetical protein
LIITRGVTMSFDIFLSYSRADHQLAQRFVEAAATRGVSVWFDDQIEGGENWREKIVEALGSAEALVILFSERSNQSTQLIKELALADNLRKRVVPVLISNCEPRGAYLYELASLNWINIHPNPETRLAGLVDTLIAQLDLRRPDPAAASVSRATPAPVAPEAVLPAAVPPAAVPPAAVPPAAALSPSRRQDERWFPLARRDLYFIVPILLGAFLTGLFTTGENKYMGLGVSTIASFVYMLLIAVRNARLNRSVFSGRSFASYVAVMVIGTSPVLVSEANLSDTLPAFFGLIIIALFVAMIANLVQVALRKTFQQSLFRKHIFDAPG